MSILRIAIVFLLCDTIFIMARKLKRRESYHLNAPPPPPATPLSGHTMPYTYEDINHDEFPPQHIQQHYESGNYQVHDTSTGDGGSSSSSSSSAGAYYIDNGLRNLAKGSADQANSAVANQNAAGKQASYVAKNTLAQAAAQAASTAIAVLKGKELLLRRLEEQNSETHKALESELTQLQQAKRSAKAAQYSAQQAINHVAVLTATLNNAHAASELAQTSASEAANELASQIDMVAQAKSKLEQSEQQLYGARLDYEETKQAVEKATHSAQEAQYNANDAAAHANLELSESGSTHIHINAKSDRNVGKLKYTLL